MMCKYLKPVETSDLISAIDLKKYFFKNPQTLRRGIRSTEMLTDILGLEIRLITHRQPKLNL